MILPIAIEKLSVETRHFLRRESLFVSLSGVLFFHDPADVSSPSLREAGVVFHPELLVKLLSVLSQFPQPHGETSLVGGSGEPDRSEIGHWMWRPDMVVLAVRRGRRSGRDATHVVYHREAIIWSQPQRQHQRTEIWPVGLRIFSFVWLSEVATLFVHFATLRSDVVPTVRQPVQSAPA